MSIHQHQALQEVEAAVSLLGVDFEPPIPSYYNTSLHFPAAIPLPEQRARAKKGFSFSGEPHNVQRRIWNQIWKASEDFNVLNQCLFYFESRKQALELQDWKVLKTWVNKIDNWAHSDGLSNLYAFLHEDYPSEVYPVYVRWNPSKKPWARRQSVVGLYYYSALRKKRQPSWKKSSSLVKNLIHDKHLYVQKGVGWTLREMYNVYPDKTWKLLQEYAREIPPAGWQAATEKLPKAKKAELKKMRQS